MSNGAFAGWNQIGGSDTRYSVVGVGDFYGSGREVLGHRTVLVDHSWSLTDTTPGSEGRELAPQDPVEVN